MFCENCLSTIRDVAENIVGEDPLLQTARVQNLLNSNEQPSDTEAASMRENRSRHRQRLEELDEQILQAKKLLSNLKAARQQVAVAASKFDLILHPMRRLPDDLLCAISLASICTDFWNAESFQNAKCESTLWRLTHICSRWRAAATAYSPLWSCITAHLTGTNSSNGAVLQLGLRLQRSRTCPLAVWLYWTEVPSNSDPLLLALLPSSFRWKTLMITGSLCPETLLAPIRGFLPLLESLFLQFQDMEFKAPDTPIPWFEFAPRLKNVQTSLIIPTSFLYPRPHLTSWTVLYCRGQNPLNILTEMSSIEVCDLHIIAFGSGLHTGISSPCNLVRLREFSLNGAGDDISKFLDDLTLPALQELELRYNCQVPSSIASLIERSNAPLIGLFLTTRIRLSGQLLTRILEAAPQLQRIELGAEDCFTNAIVRKLTLKPESLPLVPSLQKMTLLGALPCATKLLVQMIHSRCVIMVHLSSILTFVDLDKGVSFSDDELSILHSCEERGLELRNGGESITAIAERYIA